MKPKVVGSPIIIAPVTSQFVHEPYGVCLIIAPFNFPINLAVIILFILFFDLLSKIYINIQLWPLVGAIAAGNCVVLKPSENAKACAIFFETYIPQYLDNNCIAVVNGGIPESTALLQLQWDKILYTGGAKVGKIVLQAAAKHLTPVTLELGGKNAVIIDEEFSDILIAARRVLHGRLINVGQLCVAPDYVLCHRKVRKVRISIIIVDERMDS